MKNAHIAFIGGGNMAWALVAGLIADGYPQHLITVAEPDEARRLRLATRLGVETVADNAAAAEQGEILVLAVKPQVLPGVAMVLAPVVQRRRPLVISIAAGVREAALQHWLGGGVALVRAMPNTPAMIQSGATVLHPSPEVSEAQKGQAESILRAVGLVLWVEEESAMDAVTALSGSGPAYFFLFMEALEDAGIALGLAPETARLLTLQTALGSARMAMESDDPPPELRRKVTSPGGTTERALEVFEAGDLRGLVRRALEAARARSEELSSQWEEER